MPRNGDNIFLRKDGRWEARYVKGYELSGKIRYGFCYGKSYVEAKAKAEKSKAALADGEANAIEDKRLRFGCWCEQWLRRQKGAVKESTYVKYDSTLRRHILPKLGLRSPSSIDTQAVETFKQQLLAEGLSVQSVKNALMVLHAVLRYGSGMQPGLFPAVDIRYPREPRKELRVLSPAEQRRLTAYLQADTDACKMGVLLALMTGLRIGELCALKWDMLSVRDRTLRVDATMQRIRDLSGEGGNKTKILIGAPKSETSARTIPLTREMVKLCRRFDPHKKNAYVLTGTEEYMEPRKLQYRFKQYTKDCGLEGVHFHTLRHTFATRCVEAGFEIKALSEVMGHARVSTTLDRYVHTTLEQKRLNMEKLDAQSHFTVK